MTPPSITDSTTAVLEVRRKIGSTRKLIVIMTDEPDRVKFLLHRAFITKDQADVHYWSTTKGLCTLDPNCNVKDIQNDQGRKGGPAMDPQQALQMFTDWQTGSAHDDPEQVLIMENVHLWWKNQAPPRLQAFLDASRDFSTQRKTVIIIGNHHTLPAVLAKSAEIVNWPLPTVAELTDIVDRTMDLMASTQGTDTQPEDAEKIASLITGFTAEQAETALYRTAVEQGQLAYSPDVTQDLLSRKKVLVDALGSGALEFIETNITPADVGGLETLIEYLYNAYELNTPQAAAYGLAPKKGVAMLGVAGTGKSLVAKLTAHIMGLPLLRIDFGAMMTSLLGESEASLNRALLVIEAMAPAIVWVDEADKMLVRGDSFSGDSGTSKRILGTWQYWLQEKASKKGIFAVLTANYANNIDVSMFRRVGKAFYLPYPSASARDQVLRIHSARYPVADIDQVCDHVVPLTGAYTPAELEIVCATAAELAFVSGSDAVTVDHYLVATEKTVPASVSMPDQIQAMIESCRAFTPAEPVSDNDPLNTGYTEQADRSAFINRIDD